MSSGPEMLEPKTGKLDQQLKERTARRRKGEEEDAPTIKVRRVSGMTEDGRVKVREDDRFDEVVVNSEEWTLADMLQDLFTASGQAEDFQNWTVKILQDGKCKPVALDSTPAALHPEVVLVKKGG